MMRVVVLTNDATMAAHVGGDTLTTLKTFHINDAQLEEFLRQKMGKYQQRQVIGVELLDEPKI